MMRPDGYLSGCHKLEFYRNGSKDRAVFQNRGYQQSIVFTARRYASAAYVVVVCPYVRPSVTRRYCIKTAKCENKQQRHTIAQGL